MSAHHTSRRVSHQSKQHRPSDLRALEQSTHDSESSLALASPNLKHNPVRHDETFFTFDGRGDDQNLRYGQPDRYKTPRYRSQGYGRLVGLDQRYFVSTSATFGSQRQVVDRSQDSTRSSKLESLLAPPPDEYGIPLESANHNGPESTDFINQRDFVRLGFKRRKTTERFAGTGDVFNESSDEDSDHVQNASPSRDEVEVDSFAAFRNDVNQQRNIELQRTLRDNPENITAWDALINLQQALFFSSTGTEAKAEKINATARRTVTEMEIAVCEHAIASLSASEEKEKFQLKLMQLGARVWDFQRQKSNWHEMLKSGTTRATAPSKSLTLEIAFLDFQQTNHVDYSIEDRLKGFETVLSAMQISIPSSVHRDEMAVYLLLRLTSLLREADFIERGIGIWQATLELNFFKPPNLETQHVSASLEQFWDSEKARIGEEGAKGWSSGIGAQVESRSDPVLPVISKEQQDVEDALRQWCQNESAMSRKCPLPARTLDETSEDDPFRIVMFSDVRPFLFEVSTIEGKEMLIMGFLQFSSLPPVLGSGHAFNVCRKWWLDPFLTTYSPLSLLKIESTSGVPRREEVKDNDIESHLSNSGMLATPFIHVIPDIQSLFHSTSDFSIWSKFGRDESRHPFSTWAKNTLVQLISATPKTSSIPLALDEPLAEYTIALINSSGEKGKARRLCKTLLKERTTYFPARIYNAYAVLESSLENLEKAEHVWSTAMCGPSSAQSAQTSSSFSNLSIAESLCSRYKLQLYYGWIISLLFHHRKHNRALKVLLLIIRIHSSVSSSDANSSTILEKLSDAEREVIDTEQVNQTFTFLRSALLESLRGANHHEVGICSDLLMTVAYLVHERSLKHMNEELELSIASMNVPSTTSKVQDKQNANALDVILEQMHQNRAKLIYFHTCQTALYSPRELLGMLRTSLPAYPENTVIWTIYHHIQRKAGIMDRLRDKTSFLPSHGAGSQQITMSLLLNIVSELTRPSYSGSTANSIRAAFLRAAEVDSPLSNSPVLWQAYLRWELDQAATTKSKEEAQPGKRRNDSLYKNCSTVFHSALRACPWVKGLYMNAFAEVCLQVHLGTNGLTQLYQSMLERGLRMHFDISDQVL